MGAGSYPPAASPTPRSRLHAGRLRWRPFSTGITALTVTIPQPGRPRESSAPEPPSRWRTPEFWLYYVVFALALPYMAKVVVDLSRESHPNYRHFQHRLSDGWILGWKIDTSDHQWNVFRNNIPVLGALVLLWLLASRLFFGRALSPFTPADAALEAVSPSATPELASTFDSTLVSPSLAPPPINSRLNFILYFAAPLLVMLHGTSVLKIFVLLSLNFGVSRLTTTLSARGGTLVRAVPLLTWGLNIGLLFANELCDGYRFAHLSPALGFLDVEWAKGILPRWHINWNITMLRLVSFNMDHYWAVTAPAPMSMADELASTAKFTSTQPELNERTRTTTSHAVDAYSFKSYLAYALYPPLYLAGPILTFNSFRSQLVAPPAISAKTLLSYTVRFLVCLATMEIVLSSMYVVAIKDSSRAGAWMGDTPFELSMIGFWNLIVVWLKLLIPWRFFRLWSLLDGIDPPENMVRCMANNYSTLGFWRSWHRSYNLWVVRYLYIPLGGAKHAIAATLVVFTFVALWHDLSLKLLTWGWVISLFVLPEMASKKFVPVKIYGSRWWYRHVAAMGGVVNVVMMMTANLIGFAIGTEGMGYMWSKMIGSWEGFKFMFVAAGCLFVAVQIMFEYREEERRRGIVRRC